MCAAGELPFVPPLLTLSVCLFLLRALQKELTRRNALSHPWTGQHRECVFETTPPPLPRPPTRITIHKGELCHRAGIACLDQAQASGRVGDNNLRGGTLTYRRPRHTSRLHSEYFNTVSIYRVLKHVCVVSVSVLCSQIPSRVFSLHRKSLPHSSRAAMYIDTALYALSFCHPVIPPVAIIECVRPCRACEYFNEASYRSTAGGTRVPRVPARHRSSSSSRDLCD